MKVIKVENCVTCPYRTFENLCSCRQYLPVNDDTSTIPDWCPLEDIIPVCGHFDKPYCFCARCRHREM